MNKGLDSRPEVPVHLAAVPDGNRRYARENGVSEAEAHSMGADKMEDLLYWCLDLGIKMVTGYAFSTENFKRPKVEKKALMGIYSEKFRKIAQDERIHENEVRVRAIGRTKRFPREVRDAISVAENATRGYDKFHLTVAIGYGGRAEVADAARELSEKVSRGELDPEEIDEEKLESELYAPELPDPELIIRTSGERRLSGFLLWQASNSRLYFLEKYWPELEKEDLIRAIEDWKNGRSGTPRP